METDSEQILAYLEGRLGEEEKLAFERQMHESSALRKEVDDMRFIAGISEEIGKQKAFDAEKAWNRMERRLRWRNIWQSSMKAFRYAAAVLFIPLLIGGAYFYNRADKLDQLTAGRVEQRCAYGLISKVTLPDGSEVWLNSGSEISYPKQFIDSLRKVRLSGEAYFKVSSDKKHRFDVETSQGLTVSAYGTEFNVKAYDDENTIETTLTKGAVEIQMSEHSPVKQLKPGEQSVFSKQDGSQQVSEANVYMNTAWKDGKMVFRKTAMREVAARLARHFNVNITLDEDILDYTYSATFTTESIEDILRLLEATAPIRCQIIAPEQGDDYAYSKKTVIIEKK